MVENYGTLRAFSRGAKQEGADAQAPSPWLVHGALIMTQVFFGGGAVVGKFGVAESDPVTFALIREGVAGPLLCLGAISLEFCYRAPSERFSWLSRFDCSTLLTLLFCGICIWANQFLFIVGLKLSSAATASLFQPSQPIFTVAISLALGREKATALKILGIVISVAGACSIVAISAAIAASGGGSSSSGGGSGGGTTTGTHSALLGSIFFFFNCLGTSLYVIASKPMMQSEESDGNGNREPIPSLAVTALSYIIASLLMAATAMVVNNDASMLEVICGLPANVTSAMVRSGDVDPASFCGGVWTVNPAAAWALAYWIVCNSALAYALMTWGNKYAPASAVSAYTTIQPVCSTILGFLLLPWHPTPTLADLGGILIVAGLVLVVRDAVTEEEHEETGEEDAALLS